MAESYREQCEVMHRQLSRQGIRLFDLAIDDDIQTLVHPAKTLSEWRKDVRSAIEEGHAACAGSKDTCADDLKNETTASLRRRGYLEVHDVVSDVYEGRVADFGAKIVDSPSHDVQEDGFGHYGFDARRPSNIGSQNH